MIIVLKKQCEDANKKIIEGLNFVGGGCESHANYVGGKPNISSARPETSEETAKQEFEEELSPIIGRILH